MWKLTWHSFPERKRRATLVVTVIAAMTMLFGSILSLAGTVNSTAIAIARATGGEVAIQPTDWLASEGASELPNALLTESLTSQFSGLEGVESASPGILGLGVVAMQDDGKFFIPALAPTVAGYFPTSDTSPLAIKEGRAPTGEGEVAVDAKTLRALGHGLDEDIRLVTENQSSSIKARVVGVVEVRDTAPGDSSIILLSERQARAEFLDGQDGWNWVALSLADGADARGIVDAIAKLAPYGYSARTAAEIDRANHYWTHPRLSTAQVTLLLAGVAVVLATITLGGIAFGRLARKQRDNMAELRAMGASRFSTWLAVMAEAGAVGLFGSLIGGIGAFALQFLSHAIAASAGLDLGLPSPGLTIFDFLATVGMGLICTLLGAYPRAAAIAATYPVADRRSGKPPRWFGDEAWSGVGFMLVGLLLMVVLRLPVTVPVPLAWAVAGMIALVGGAVVAAPAICQPIMRRLGGLLVKPVGAIARVATSQAVGDSTRITLSVATLLIGTALMTAPETISASGQATAHARVPESYAVDVLVTSQRDHHFPPEIAQAVHEIPGVTAVNPIGIHEVATDKDTKFKLASADVGYFEAIYNTEMASGHVPARTNEVMISDVFAEQTGLKLSDLLHLRVGWKPQAMRIVGIFQVAGSVDPPEAVALPDGTKAIGLEDWHSVLGVKIDATGAEARDRIAPALGDNPLLRVVTPADLAQERADRVAKRFEPFKQIGRLTLIAGVIAMALILVLSVIDRKQEYGSLRVVGADRRQIAVMVAAEGVVLSFLGVLLGLVTGWISGWGIRQSVVGHDYSNPAVPWLVILATLLGSLPLGLVAAAPAASLASCAEPSDSKPGTF